MAQSTAETDANTYEQFIEKVRRIENLGAGAGVLQWDQEVKMPDEGIAARSQQLSTLSAVIHEEFTDEAMGGYLDDLESAELDSEQAAVVREVRRQYERKTRVPTELVEEISRTTSEALPKWKEAKAEDDFSIFAPILEELIELKKEYAEHIDPDADPYEVLFADYEPYIELEKAEEMLVRLREELVPLIDAVADSEADLAVDAFAGEFDPDTQETLARDALDALGYDWDRGRLDTAPHPFSTGNQFDARVTTRFDETDLLGGLTSTIHEFGHATYTLGLPDEHYATPLGDSRDLTVHESQSRLWENHVGRSRAFWDHFLPRVEERFPQVEASVEEAYEAANQVHDDN
ncbi:MAG: carboxypeptidase M32, partial [Halalkalicoccus sp.]|nr:carboxypeptidase M32 [Halalkalicoccus sp.]